MVPLYVLKPREVEQKLKKLGFELVRQKGSHRQYKHVDGRLTTVPFHKGHDVSPVLLKKIATDIGMNMQDFMRF